MPKRAECRNELTLYFAAVFAITWGIGGLYVFLPEQMTNLFGAITLTSPIYFIAVYAPTISALVISLARRGIADAGTLLLKLRPKTASWPYYLAVLLGWPVLDSAALGLQSLVTGEPLATLEFKLWYLAPVVLVTALLTDAGPMGEELGWRGFALPRLLALFSSPLGVAIGLGLVWGVWHLPAFFVSGTAQHSTGMGIAWLIAGTTLTSIIMTWIYRRTGGDVLAAGLLVHLMNNLTQAKLPFVVAVYLPLAIAAGIALFRSKGPVQLQSGLTGNETR